MKGKIAGLIGLLGALTLGCSDSVVKYGRFRDFDGYVNYDSEGVRRVTLMDKQGVLYAHDESYIEERFSEIDLRAPQGHPLEQYANPDSLELAYKIMLFEE